MRKCNEGLGTVSTLNIRTRQGEREHREMSGEMG